MKTLYIIRHAKSSWSFNQLDDFNRPLGKRGRKDVLEMGKHVASKHTCPNQFITSSASRAFYTALHYADSWGFPEQEISIEPALYHADEDEIIELIKNDAREDKLAIFGHNPGFTGLANLLTGKYIDNIPTCAVYVIEFDIREWDDIENVKGKQIAFYKPKNI